MTQNPFEQVAGADILIVDDTPDNIRFLSSLLTQKGCKVRKALNGQMALIAAKTLIPDLILLDINMPEMDGYEVCRRLKEDQETCSIPVVFLSAWSEAEDKVRAFEAGGIDYITKPFQFEEVLIRIHNQLTIRNLQRQLQTQNSRLEQALQTSNRSHFQTTQYKAIAQFTRLAIGVMHGIHHPLTQISNYLAVMQQTLPKLPQSIQAAQNQGTQVSLSHSFNSEQIDSNTLLSDLDQAIDSIQAEAKQIQAILSALHHFAEHNPQNEQAIDIHQALDQSLLLLQPFFTRSDGSLTIELVKDYGRLSAANASPGKVHGNSFNHVIFSLLNYAINVLESENESENAHVQANSFQPTLRITTEMSDRETVLIYIQNIYTPNNGAVNSVEGFDQITEPVAAGDRLPIELLTCQQIVETLYQGHLTYQLLENGSEFIVEMPVSRG